MTESATGYLKRLSDLFLATEASDGDGVGRGFDDAAIDAAGLIRATVPDNRKIILVGNGGSAAVVSHMQNDLCKACGCRALVFTEQPLLTALANDAGYDSAYETATRLWVDEGDLAIAVSSSGSSANILRAVDAARTTGANVITMSGFEPDNPLRSRGDINFYIRSSSYGHVETAHAAVGHYLTDAVAGLITAR
jgi:D-sedoheptulose 7-phosphate isomerase